MPHLVLETSPGLLTLELADSALRGAHEALAQEPSVDAASIKSRWAEAIHAFPAHAHLELRLLEGRDAQVLTEISDRLWQVLQDQLSSVNCLLTLEVRTMDRATYRK